MNGITERAKKEATTTTIHKINRLLEQRIEAFDRAFREAGGTPYITATVGLLAAIDGRFDYYRVHPEDAPPAIVILARKAGFRYEFPQRMVELMLVPATDDANSNGLPDSVESRIAYPNARAYLIAADQASATPTANFEPTATEITDLVNARWTGEPVLPRSVVSPQHSHSMVISRSRRVPNFCITRWWRLVRSGRLWSMRTSSAMLK